MIAVQAFGGNNTSGPIDVATARSASASASGRMDFASETFLVAGTLNANGKAAGSATQQDAESGLLLVTHTLTGEGFDASEDGTGRGTPLVPVAFAHQAGGTQTTLGYDPQSRTAPTLAANQTPAICFSAKDHGADAAEDLAPTLRAGRHSGSHANAGVMPAIAFQTRGSNLDVGSISGTMGTNAGDASGGAPMVAQPYTLAIRGRGESHDLEARQDGTANALLTPNGGRGGIGVGAIALPMQVRRLTPRECARLQGFPDDYLDITYRSKPAADGPKYKALGNSWAIPCVRWIGERIDQVEAIQRFHAAVGNLSLEMEVSA